MAAAANYHPRVEEMKLEKLERSRQVECPSCMVHLLVPADHQGILTCGHCQRKFVVQAARPVVPGVGQASQLASQASLSAPPAPQSEVVPGAGLAYRTQEDKPFRTTCQHCRTVVTTNVRKEKGIGVWGAFGLCCCFGCWLRCCLVPCCLNVTHVCHFKRLVCFPNFRMVHMNKICFYHYSGSIP